MSSNANLSELYYRKETVFSEAPAGAKLKRLQMTDTNLKASKMTDTSKTITGDRSIEEIIKLGWQNTGQINTEFRIGGHYNDLFLGLLQDAAWRTTTFTTRGDITGNNTLTPNTPAVAAVLSTDLSGNNGDLDYTAVTPGAAGNLITIAYIDPPGNNAALSVVVTGNAIVVNLATDGSSVITSTASQVRTAVLANSDAAALVGVANKAGNDGSGLVTAMPATALSGGDGGAFPAIIQGAKFVRIAGANASNNGVRRVVSCSATALVVETAGFPVNETDVTVTVYCNYIRNGSTFHSFGFEKQNHGMATPNYEYFRGNFISAWNIQNDARAIIASSFTIMGTQGTTHSATQGDGDPTAAPARTICTTTENIGGIFYDGVDRSDVLSLNMTYDNTGRERPRLGSAYTKTHGSGNVVMTGTLNCYFETQELLEDFLEHSAHDILNYFRDASGNIMSLHMPRCQPPDTDQDISGENTDLMVAYQFQATKSPTLGYAVQLDQVDAA